MLPTLDSKTIEQDFVRAREAYDALGVEVDAAIAALDAAPLSLQCWQGDDVVGFEVFEGHSGPVDGGGILATGGYPGRARNGDELRQDYDKAFSLIPGPCRANLHALYAETGGKAVPRNEQTPEHFSRWIDWAKAAGIGLDFNPSFFAHPMANSGYTLASADDAVRAFWIEHGIAGRGIARAMGEETAGPCVINFWMPDGAKDHPIDRFGPRLRMMESLDTIFAEEMPEEAVLDALEGKLFGLGSEDYVVGSHDFLLAYCLASGKMLCMDTGHYHPTESVADKISSVMAFSDRLLLHVSRGVRWDSDHVVIDSDDVRALCHELVRGDVLDRVHLALDFFDASINRIGAWAVGARAFKRALLGALLEPTATLRAMEADGRGAEKLGLLQEAKALPVGAVWNHYCQTHNVPAGPAWLDELKRYEDDVLSKR